MSERSTARLRAIGDELTEFRKNAELSTRKAADRLGVTIATLNRTENAKRRATVAEVAAMLAVYGIKGSDRQRLLDLVEEKGPSGWLVTSLRRPRLLAFHGFEAKANSIVNFSPHYVPGLLQTPAYTRVVMRMGEIVGDEQDRRVAERMKRQRILDRTVPPQYLAILDEAVLRRPFGGPEIMADQVRWLMDRAKQPNVSIRIIPFRHGAYRNPGYFTKLEFRDEPPLVYLEHEGVSGFLDDPSLTQKFRDRTTNLTSIALGCAESVNFMARMLADYERI